MKKSPLEIVFLLIRLALGGIFIYASIYKIQDPGAFAHQIYNYKILPPFIINTLALTLPWLQLFCGLCLIFNKAIKGASFLVMGMLFVFQAAVASALLRGLNISCGCFKSGGSPANWLTFGRDSLMLIVAILQYWKVQFFSK